MQVFGILLLSFNKLQRVLRCLRDVGIGVEAELAELRFKRAISNAADDGQDRGQVLALTQRFLKKWLRLFAGSNKQDSGDSSNSFVL